MGSCSGHGFSMRRNFGRMSKNIVRIHGCILWVRGLRNYFNQDFLLFLDGSGILGLYLRVRL